MLAIENDFWLLHWLGRTKHYTEMHNAHLWWITLYAYTCFHIDSHIDEHTHSHPYHLGGLRILPSGFFLQIPRLAARCFMVFICLLGIYGHICRKVPQWCGRAVLFLWSTATPYNKACYRTYTIVCLPCFPFAYPAHCTIVAIFHMISTIYVCNNIRRKPNF